MRIVFTADWHLGIDTHSTNRVGIPSRTQDSIDAIRRIFRKAEDLEANVLIVGGDLFHHPNPRPLFIHEAIGLLDDASHIFKYVLVIAGNHDPKPAGGKGPIGLLESCRIGKNLMFFEDNDWDILLNPVHFAIRPYLKKVNTLKDAEIQSSIMVAHHHFSGATVGTESFMLAGGVPELSGKMKNTDLILSGHIHKPQMVRIKGTPVLYPGSPTRFDFSDRADDKGFWLVEIGEDDSIEHDFVKIDNRRMVQLYRGGRWLEKTDEECLRGMDIEGADVKMTFRTDDVSLVNTVRIRDLLKKAGAHYVAPIQVEIHRETRTREKEITKERADEDCVELWVENNDTGEFTKQEIVEAAREVMDEDSGD